MQLKSNWLCYDENMKIALIQTNSSADMAANIMRVGAFVTQAAEHGATFISTPENTFLMEAPGQERVFFAQEEHPGVIAARGWAKRYGVWILLGSVAIISPVSGKAYNRSLLIDPQGEVKAAYDKIHMFDVDVPGDRRYAESDRMLAGNQLATAPLDGEWKLGLTICYDVRFPHLYRALAKSGANIIAVPAAFTAITGEAHWHTLLRARAIENGCYIVAAAQTGTHPGMRKTFGHSLVVNPWGEVIADGGVEEGVVFADIDVAEVAKVRARIPSLEHDRDFIS